MLLGLHLIINSLLEQIFSASPNFLKTNLELIPNNITIEPFLQALKGLTHEILNRTLALKPI